MTTGELRHRSTDPPTGPTYKKHVTGRYPGSPPETSFRQTLNHRRGTKGSTDWHEVAGIGLRPKAGSNSSMPMEVLSGSSHGTQQFTTTTRSRDGLTLNVHPVPCPVRILSRRAPPSGIRDKLRGIEAQGIVGRRTYPSDYELKDGKILSSKKKLIAWSRPSNFPRRTEPGTWRQRRSVNLFYERSSAERNDPNTKTQRCSHTGEGGGRAGGIPFRPWARARQYKSLGWSNHSISGRRSNTRI